MQVEHDNSRRPSRWLLFVIPALLLAVATLVSLYVYLGSHERLDLGRVYVMRIPFEWRFQRYEARDHHGGFDVYRHGVMYCVGPFGVTVWEKK
jgi:hypothetical protein